MALLSQLSDYVPLMYEEAPVSPERLMRLLPCDQSFQFLHTFVEEDTKSFMAKAKVQDEFVEASNETKLSGDIWANIFSYLNPSNLYKVMRVCHFCYGISLREEFWSRFWLASQKPAPLNPLAPSWKMQYKYFSDVIVKHGFVEMRAGSIFVTYIEVLLVLAGTELHIFELPEGRDTQVAKRLVNGFASLKSLRRVTKIATPSRTIPLHNTILIHQQVQALESVKRFGFKFPDEEEVWFAIPKTQLQRSKNWLKVLYFYSKQLKTDLGLEI